MVRAARPTNKKPCLQPRAIAMVGSKLAPIIPPTLMAVWLNPRAVALSFEGNQRIIAFTAEGKIQPAPSPEITKMINSVRYEGAKNTPIRQIPMIKVPVTSILLIPMRSTIHPAAIIVGPYTKVAALTSKPTCALERPKVSLRNGASGPMLSLVRKTVRKAAHPSASTIQR
jgi:hypothetical protein